MQGIFEEKIQVGLKKKLSFFLAGWD